MKTTLEIADDILLRAKRTAKQRGVTMRSLVESGLTMVLLKESPKKVPVVPVTFRGKSRQPGFADASWEKIRDTIYPAN